MLNPFRESDGILPNTLAIAFATLGWAAGVYLLTLETLGSALVGIPLLAAALVVGAYLVHDCAHSTLFRRPADNARLGTLLCWVVGACYAGYDAIRDKHLIHHASRIDNVTVDYRPILRARPWLRRTVQALEWAYVPAVDLLMHGLVMASPWLWERHRDRRGRMALMVAVRVAAFTALAAISLPAVLMYALGYMLFLHALRFFDAFQHTYELKVVRDRGDLAGHVTGSKDYEEANTYSNPLSLRFPSINLICLNFVYHNVHHLRPSEPWYRLPALHAQRYGSLSAHTFSPRQAFKNYHRYRVARVIDDYGDEGQGMGDPERFAGALGLSFLTHF